MAKEPKFQVNDKVKVIQGGFGIHPDDKGRVLTISGVCFEGCTPDMWSYSVEEDLTHVDKELHKTRNKAYWIAETSFGLVSREEPPQTQHRVSVSKIGHISKVEVEGHLSRVQIEGILNLLYS